MLKKVNAFINIVMGAFIGAFAGSAIYRYFDYKSYPDLYAAQSAPWYLDIQITGIALAVILMICVVIKAVIRRKLKR